MFSADGILGSKFAIMAAGLDGLAMRQQAHTQNLANIDTKNYRAKTVDFESVLAGAIDKPGSSMAGGSGLSANGAMLPNSMNDAMTAGSLSSHFSMSNRTGGNGTVDRTQETTAMMNDNIRFRVLSQQVTNRISELRNVIAEMGRG